MALRHVAIASLLIALAAPTLLPQVAARSLLQSDHTHAHGDHAHEGSINTLRTRLEFDDQIALEELRGLWLGDGDQYSSAVWDIFEDTTSLPNCSVDVNQFNYAHFAPEDDHFIMITGTEGSLNRFTAAHKTTNQFRVQNYTNNIIGMYNNATGATSCSFFKPYLDLRTGHLKAEIINMNLYSRNSTGQRVSQSLNCQVVGNELPGCYTDQVARATDLEPLVQAASVNANPPSPQINIPADSVVSVNVQTYTCRNGECLTLAPKYEDEEHSH